VQQLHRDVQSRQRAADAALLRKNLPHLTDEQIEPLAEVVRSSLTGLALWWLDHPHVERHPCRHDALRRDRSALTTRCASPATALIYRNVV
jgi:hypothetical protein